MALKFMGEWRAAHEWSNNKSVAAILAGNIRAYRQLRMIDQNTLAQRMETLGTAWRQVTVSEVERIQRNVTVPELVALTLALGVSIEQLLDPRGPERRTGPRLALSVGFVKTSEDGDLVEERAMGPLIAPQDVTALVCSHQAYAVVEWNGPSDRRFTFIDFVHGPDVADVGPEGPTT